MGGRKIIPVVFGGRPPHVPTAPPVARPPAKPQLSPHEAGLLFYGFFQPRQSGYLANRFREGGYTPRLQQFVRDAHAVAPIPDHDVSVLTTMNVIRAQGAPALLKTLERVVNLSATPLETLAMQRLAHEPDFLLQAGAIIFDHAGLYELVPSDDYILPPQQEAGPISEDLVLLAAHATMCARCGFHWEAYLNLRQRTPHRWRQRMLEFAATLHKSPHGIAARFARGYRDFGLVDPIQILGMSIYINDVATDLFANDDAITLAYLCEDNPNAPQRA
jgi:hypothetical protein